MDEQPQISNADVFEDDFFASLYDSLNSWSACDDFYLARAVDSGGPVLNLGCGTGVLACAIAAKGIGVTAVDPSAAMLRVARSCPGADKVQWIESDGQGLRLPQRFRFIYMTGHAFQQLMTDEAAVDLLRAAAAHLDPEGQFVFETRNPAFQAWLSWTPERSQRTVQSPQHGRISLFYDAQHDAQTGIVTIREHYDLLDQQVQRVGINRIRFIDQDHLSRLLKEAGLTAVAWYGDWYGNPFSPSSREMIVATRRNESTA